MKKAILFDLDGTLVDTPKGIVETFTAVLKRMAVNVEPAAIHATIGMPLQKAFVNFLGGMPEDPHIVQAIEEYQAFFKEIVLPKAKNLVFPGVMEGLQALKAKGFVLAVATSKIYKSAESLIKAAELWPYFDLIVGADQVSQPKPHPEMGQFILKTLKISSENACMVGDTTHDLHMAREAGMRSIGVTYGIHDITTLKTAMPTWIVDSFTEVVACIQAWSTNTLLEVEEN